MNRSEALPVAPVSLIRQMRGKSGARLAKCDDGNFYVIKFADSAATRSLLANEWLAAKLMRTLNILTPEPSLVRVTANSSCLLPQGLHFGSRFPGDPEHDCVYDFLPAKCFSSVENLRDFAKVLVFDVWVGKNDERQSVFSRQSLPSSAAGQPNGKRPFLAHMVDNKNAFGGADWCLETTLSVRPHLVRAASVVPHIQCAMKDATSAILAVTESEIRKAAGTVPKEWLAERNVAFQSMLCLLYERKSLLTHALAAELSRIAEPKSTTALIRSLALAVKEARTRPAAPARALSSGTQRVDQ